MAWPKKSMGSQVSAGLNTQGSAEIMELLSAIQGKQSWFWGAAGSKLCRRAREVHHSSGLGGWFHRSQTLAMCGKHNKNLHWSRQQVLIQRLALASQTWTPFYDFNLFYLLMQLIVLKSLPEQGGETKAKHSCSKAEGNNKFSVKTVTPQGGKKKPAIIESSFWKE